jgi:hypothetical protein
MAITLRPYQKDLAQQAVHKIKTLGMVYLAMEVRTGKTHTAIKACDLLVGHKRGKVVFVTKKKAIGSIDKDFADSGATLDMTVINYESLHKLEAKNVDVFIFDEAQKLKQYPKPGKDALFNKAKDAMLESPYCKIILLSGTPSPESYSELYHQFAISEHYNPFAEYDSFYKWAVSFVNIVKIDFGNGPVNDYSGADRTKVMAVLEPYFLTYTQDKAGFENKVNEYVLTVKMKPSTYAVCDKLVRDKVVEGKTGVILGDTPAKLMQKCHQLYSGTCILEEGQGVIIDDTKAIFVRDKFKGKKIAILYRYKLELDLLKQTFPNWTDSPEAFRDDDTLTYFGQIVSSREGINLSTADGLIFYNIDHASLSYFQARDRCTSKDRVKPNNVYWIFSEDGIEERIYDAVINKKDYTTSYFKRDFGGVEKKIEQLGLNL